MLFRTNVKEVEHLECVLQPFLRYAGVTTPHVKRIEGVCVCVLRVDGTWHADGARVCPGRRLQRNLLSPASRESERLLAVAAPCDAGQEQCAHQRPPR
eukprot:5095464-Prymnesium_polylepis.1